MKRLESLDALRGFSVFSMVPVHGLMVIAWVLGLYDLAEQEAVTAEPGPERTTLALFFFVTGVTLAVVLAMRLRKQSFGEAARHLVLRYAVYLLIGSFYNRILFAVGFGSSVDVEGIINITDPIASLSLTAILALVFIHRLSWKQLVATAIGLTVVMAIVLSLPQASSLQVFPLRIFFTNSWAVLKMLPLVFTGAAIGKLMVEGRNLRRPMFLVGLAISLAYLVGPSLMQAGTPLAAFIFVGWTFHHATIFMVGAGLFLFGLMLMLEARKWNLTFLTVMGRTSLIVFYLHFTLGIAVLIPLGGFGITLLPAVALVIIVTIATWLICYFYARWRWGSPSTWYGPT